MIRVRCQQHVSIDAKGRLALPAPIRRALEEMGEQQLVLTYSSQGSVWAWTQSHYEQKVELPLMEQDPFSPEVLDFAHSLMSTANDVEVDGQGRLRIPPVLRELAGLDKDCVVHVLLGRIEIWDRLAWEARFQDSVHAARARRAGMPGAAT
jgi:MraZ protein